MNMLLVEDDERIVEFMKRGLEAEQWSVFHVRNHQEYERMIVHDHVDFALCDIVLGQENGLDLCRRIRREFPSIPIVVMTAKDSPCLYQRSLTAGADGYLPKPFSFDALLTKIDELIGRHQERKASLQWRTPSSS